MRNFILTLLLTVCAVTPAYAYEYVFDWSKLQIESGSAGGETTYPQTPNDFIDVYIHGNSQQLQSGENFMIYAWLDDGTKLFGDWPGADIATVGEMKAIAKSNDLENTTEYYKVHFDLTDVNFIISVNGQIQTADLNLNGAGSYFFNYDRYAQNIIQQVFGYYSDGDVIQDFISTSGNPTIYARIMDDSNFTPTIYMWHDWDNPRPDWSNQAEMQPVVIKGQTWYKYFIDEYFGNVKFIISDHGNNTTQTSDITLTHGGSNHFDYWPTGYGDRYQLSTLDLMSGTNDFAEVEMVNPQQEEEVSFTVEGEHGTATFTIHCKHSDINKVQIIDGELQFPVNSYFSATVNDGYNLNRIWVGNPSHGDQNYQFDQNVLKPCDGSVDVTDMGTVDNGLWNGNHQDHLYNISNNSNTIVSGYVTNTGADVVRTGTITRIYSEGTSLEDLVDAHYGVKQLNHAFDHDLVGVQARDNGNEIVLICRSVDYVANQNPIKEGQKSLIDPSTGQPFEWSDPNTKQYAWIALQLPAGTDLTQYEGKQLHGIRGMYCSNHDNQGWHISWYNPTMIVDEIRPDQIVAENVPTHFNTYTVANLTDQSYQHIYDDSDNWNNPADRPNENGVKEFTISGEFYFIMPRLWEICNLTNVMRTDDEVIYVPDSRAIMPTDITYDEFGNVINEVIRPNYFEQNNIEGYANIQRPYEGYVIEKSIWNKADTISLGVEHINEKWRMRYKTYDIPEALVFASDFHPNDYPLSVPDRNYDIEYARSGNIGFHIIGIPVLNNYEKDIFVSASDYWSRYKYNTDVNVYRNDLHIAPNTLKPDFANYGNLIVYREEYRGNQFVREVPIARIIQRTSTNLRAGANRVEYGLEYLNLAEDNKARRDDLLKPYNEESYGTMYTPIPVQIAAADTAYNESQPGLINRTFVIGEGSSDHYVNVYDMFYSNRMMDIATNETLATDYYYRVVPEVEQPNLEEVSGYAPIYKTDVNIVNHATYTQEEVDGDKNNQLMENNNVTINFTPNQSIPVTEYRVYSGSWTESDTKINKDANTLVVAPDKFLTEPISVETSVTPGRVHVPEAYTTYNDNTYGCYKQKVGNATITTNAEVIRVGSEEFQLFESEENIYRDNTVDEEGNTVVDSSQVTKLYHVNLLNVTQLLMEQLNEGTAHNESRYMIRMWRQVEGDDDAVLLNDINNTTDGFATMPTIDTPNGPEPLFSLNGSPDLLLTHYDEMDEMVRDNDSPEAVQSPVSDTFYHHELPEGATITYYATLYVYDEDAGKYYVKQAQVVVTSESRGVITGIEEMQMGTKLVSSTEYFNISGMRSNQPFDGVNIVVVRYTDGTTSTFKMINTTK